MGTRLSEIADECDAAVRKARGELVRAVREAAADGLTQSEIGREIGRSQPEVSRLLRFHGTSRLARKLRVARPQVIRLIGQTGGRNVRVFGSVATGADHDGSDIDLVFTMTRPLSLLELGALEGRVADAVGASVDLLPDSSIRPAQRRQVLAEATPL